MTWIWMQIEVFTSAYLKAQKWNEGSRPIINSLSQSCEVSWRFVNKIENELMKFGRELLRIALQKNNDIPHDPGFCSLDKIHQFIISFLYLLDPSCTLPSCKQWLCYFTETDVSTSSQLNFLFLTWCISC